jgi:hypothetical protein
VIWEARLAFILFFFLCWTIVGLVPWTVAAVASRGRGALVALPLALAAACAAGVFIPLIGLRDFTGFLISLAAAAVGGAAGAIGGIAFARRLRIDQPAPAQSTVDHPLGARRPAAVAGTASAPSDPAPDEPTPPTVT